VDLLDAASGSMRLILGGRFGEEPAELSGRRLDLFREQGGYIIETAHSYAGGAAEAVIGEWLRRRHCRDEVVVVDKVCHPHADGSPRVRPEVLRSEVTGSLKRFGLPSIDLVLLHRDDPAVAVEDLVGAFLDEVASGHISRFGVANWPAGRMVRFVEAARQAGQSPVVSYQFSLAVPQRQIWPGALHATEEILEIVRTHNLPLLAWAAQARGWFADGRPRQGPDRDEADLFQTAANHEARRRCQLVAARLGVSPTTIALAWTLHQPLCVWPAVGPESEQELTDSMAASRLALNDSDLAFLSAARLLARKPAGKL
jgi:aryl-alcohol dehydrogenase-like predicted oxidoreductase